jgi:hypothetical protein
VAEQTPEIPYRRIGTILVEWQLITDRELAQALEEQEATGRLLGEILVTSYGVSRVDLADALSEQWQEANRAATAALEDQAAGDRAAAATRAAAAPASEPLAEADLRVLLDEAESARAELTLRTEELGKRLATLETLVVGVSEALEELRLASAPAAELPHPAEISPGRRSRVRAGTRGQDRRNTAA